ncbi:hypothetical protein CEXT_648101 [Caerostris extrusa]|uniref:Uncharacterized protein n=1 Tax=Caerostris extrusa TaxID=172846 RepID=A0AAV4XYD4_CAEEX|nr:hypothetical protein CEXT_648101 [Caerostris extrusa]
MGTTSMQSNQTSQQQWKCILLFYVETMSLLLKGGMATVIGRHLGSKVRRFIGNLALQEEEPRQSFPDIVSRIISADKEITPGSLLAAKRRK